MRQAVCVLFAAAFTVGVSLAAGRLVLDRLGARLYRGERGLVAFVAGSACLSLLVFALAAAQLARAGVFAVLGGALITAAVCLRDRRPAPAPPPLPRFWAGLFAAGLALFGIFYFVHAMAPEASPDGSTHHLGLVNLYLRHGGLCRLETSLFGSFPQGMEMLYLFAFSFGRHSAAALVHFAFLAALPLLMLFHARRQGSPEAGVCAGLLVFASPLFGVDGTSAYLDVALACVLFATFHLLRVWARERQAALLVPIGLCAGFCYGLKYTAALAVPYALGTIAWNLRRDWRATVRAALPVCGCVAAMAVPWMLKNWLWAGNPFAPFLNRYFPNPYVHAIFEEWLVAYNRYPPGIASRWQVPWQWIVNGGVEGIFGPVFLLLPLALVALRLPAGRVLLAAGALFALPAVFSSLPRYMMPCVPFLALAMVLPLARRPRLLAALAVVHLALSWPAVRDLYCDGAAWRLDGFPLRAALRLVPEETWLTENLGGYAKARLVESRVPPGGRVFVYVGPPQAYTSREFVVEWVSAFNKRLCDVLWTPLSPELQPAWRWRFAFPESPVRAVRVVQTAAGSDVWSVSELRVYRGGRELPRAAAWRLRAHPNPWGVGDAFDNTELTRWTSGERLRPGMFVEADFGAPLPLDTVEVVGTRDQEQARLRLEIRRPDGAWTPASQPPRRWDAPWSRGALRAGVAGEFKRSGVEYLMVDDGSWGADDFRGFAPEWGLEPLGTAGAARLYRFR